MKDYYDGKYYYINNKKYSDKEVKKYLKAIGFTDEDIRKYLLDLSLDRLESK